MEGYETSEVREPPGRKKPGDVLLNVLTIVILLATILLAAAFLSIFINPHNSLNPYPPATLPPSATPTIALRVTIIPTWTPTVAVVQPSATPTRVPTDTPLPTLTMVESPIPMPTATLPTDGDFAFVTMQGSPAAIDGAQFHPEAGCKWLGVAGQATSLNGEAVKGLFVQLGGSLDGIDSVDNLTMTGLAPEYGDGGFEITLSDTLASSNGTLWIQLLDQQNLPLSNRIYFNTYDDCTKNLIIITFEQVR